MQLFVNVHLLQIVIVFLFTLPAMLNYRYILIFINFSI